MEIVDLLEYSERAQRLSPRQKRSHWTELNKQRCADLEAQYDCVGNPYNESTKHWIGIDPNSTSDDLLRDLTRNSYEIVKANPNLCLPSHRKRTRNNR